MQRRISIARGAIIGALTERGTRESTLPRYCRECDVLDACWADVPSTGSRSRPPANRGCTTSAPGTRGSSAGYCAAVSTGADHGSVGGKVLLASHVPRIGNDSRISLRSCNHIEVQRRQVFEQGSGARGSQIDRLDVVMAPVAAGRYGRRGRSRRRSAEENPAACCRRWGKQAGRPANGSDSASTRSDVPRLSRQNARGGASRTPGRRASSTIRLGSPRAIGLSPPRSTATLLGTRNERTFASKPCSQSSRSACLPHHLGPARPRFRRPPTRRARSSPPGSRSAGSRSCPDHTRRRKDPRRISGRFGNRPRPSAGGRSRTDRPLTAFRGPAPATLDDKLRLSHGDVEVQQRRVGGTFFLELLRLSRAG